MPKKTKTVAIQVNQPKIEGTPPIKPKEAEPIESKNFRVLNAEEVTKMAADFLKSLGHQQTTPTRVAQEGMRHYVVEVDLKKKNATVVIDANAKEIEEYEISDAVKKTSKMGLSKTILLICGIQITLTVLLFLLRNHLPTPF